MRELAGEHRLILQVVAGSRAHGLATQDSDTDSRGVCIPHRRFLLGLEELEQEQSDGGDHVVYALRKFVRLALAGNPNIVETLYTEEADVLVIDDLGRRLRDAREMFLSKAVGERFMRYATDQLARIERHRRWLATPPADKPTPEDYGATRRDGRDRFPDADSERNYRAALKHHNDYRRWREKRNPKRAALEEAHGYDTKHAMHLCRLLRMGREILSGEGVRVRRPDREWLSSIRAGALSYDALRDHARREIEDLPALMDGSALPDAPDREAAETLVIELHAAHLGL